MTLAEILPAARRLSTIEKLKLIRILVEDLDIAEDILPLSIATKKLHKRAWSIMDELAQNPISVKNSGKMPRDEMHDRRL